MDHITTFSINELYTKKKKKMYLNNFNNLKDLTVNG